MKVDAKIVPIEVKDGWFKKKQLHQLRFKIELTEVEKAIINKAGLRDMPTLDPLSEDDVPRPIWPWVDGSRVEYGTRNFDTLIEAQASIQQLKMNLAKLKEAMEHHRNYPTEDSFEL
jgi:hypothetical protein